MENKKRISQNFDKAAHELTLLCCEFHKFKTKNNANLTGAHQLLSNAIDNLEVARLLLFHDNIVVSKDNSQLRTWNTKIENND